MQAIEGKTVRFVDDTTEEIDLIVWATGFEKRFPFLPDNELDENDGVIDLYLNTLSQRMNSFIVDEIEILVERFSIEKIERSIRRGAKHEIRSIHWVARDLIREAQRPAAKKEKKKYRLK